MANVNKALRSVSKMVRNGNRVVFDTSGGRTESHLAITGLGKNFTHKGVDVAHLSVTDFDCKELVC